jgi:hypothetical protein
MADTTSKFLQTLERRQLPQFSGTTDAEFPGDEFQARNTIYTEAERWLNGSALEETVQVGDKDVEKYPVRINPIPSIVLKHTCALFGETNQDDRPLVYPRVLAKDKSEREAAKFAEDVLHKFWWESNGRSLQFENGMMSQVYGGCVFRLVYDPTDPLRSIPIYVDNPHPKYFVGRPSASDMMRLQECWIIKPVNMEEAKLNGVDPSTFVDEIGWQIDYYTPTIYRVTINGQPIRRQIDGQWIDPGGVNPWGFVPVVYIPHVRQGTSFYGDNAFTIALGLIKELNRRVADYGDAVSVDSHSYVGMRNVNGAPKVQQIAPNLFAVNVGSGTNITGEGNDPDIFEIQKPSASEPMHTLNEELRDEIRRHVYVPKVADGEDEGSQRSGLTLAMRMWPLTSHIGAERIFWSSGLDLLNRMALAMLRIKGEAGITEKHQGLGLKQNWAPILPRDREMIVNETVSRMGAKLGGPKHLMGMLGDVDDIEEEWNEIVDAAKEITEVTAPPKPPGTPGSTPSKNPQDKSKAASTQTGKPQSSE